MNKFSLIKINSTIKKFLNKNRQEQSATKVDIINESSIFLSSQVEGETLGTVVKVNGGENI